MKSTGEGIITCPKCGSFIFTKEGDCANGCDMNIEQQRCPKELCIEKYYGREFNDKDKIVAEFGILCDLLESYEQQILANPSEFGLVKQELFNDLANGAALRRSEIDFWKQKFTDLQSENAKLKEALGKANDVLRSCFLVIERKGSSTNFESLHKVVNDILKDQHKLMYPQSTKNIKEPPLSDSSLTRNLESAE